ncbi:MAG: glycosyltransferase [Caulobacter sp.]|nr:glycosyltransferase [Caulobacter sp.]
MKISIALAAYNGEAFLPAQLASFAAQTRAPDELVVTDDGSTDGTRRVVEDFGRTVPFAVRYQANARNLGFGQNFSRALSLCTGDLVFLSDQDDAWLESKIARMTAVAAEHPDKACFMNDALLADGELRPTGQTKLGQIRASGLGDDTFVMGCCVTVRRSLLDLILPIPAHLPSHDSWLVQTADVLGLTLRLAEPLQLYRRHGGNVSKFFVNDIDRMPLAERLKVRISRSVVRRNSTANIDRELMFMTAICGRIVERREQVAALVGADRAAGIEAALVRRVGFLERRRRIRDLGPLQRPGALTALWREGGYAVSGGLKGLIKDAIGSGPAPGVK